jgi:death-on-curing family protein
MASLHYLTVQDILWINLQVTKKVQHFNYAKLEEASFYQYAYGESNTLFPQAARFLSGFAKLHPFESGNEATALVGCLAFLQINGYVSKLSGDELVTWNRRVVSGELSGGAAIEAIAAQDPEAHHTIVPDVRTAVRKVMERYGEALLTLGSGRVEQIA